ncbi:hypothetical protein HXP44_17055 [Streptomyces sioyaensis]|uniref:Uncharacterized protein n=1 Tax=Streptomyces sioyaensis TaxID=67364 RepID=A0A4Q1RBV6_9ACTN|nr:hypothetical protein [Streptomyces sioyaensis]MBM4793728.1 hypothetical protein [Streptomyces sioyaensis]RXS70938.1 hypothetical protein EST54_02095 [Streptomyces sioyaensis]
MAVSTTTKTSEARAIQLVTGAPGMRKSTAGSSPAPSARMIALVGRGRAGVAAADSLLLNLR